MWGSFACPKCHKLLRVRRNYIVRVFRLALLTAAFCYLIAQISTWFRFHLKLGVFASIGTVAVIDEYVMRLMPAQIEPAMPGSITAS